jgi:hypothetical protein
MATVFFSYSHKDEELRDRLEQSLVMLVRQGLIEAFHDRRIPPGDELDPAISAELDRAEVILFLLSTDFLSSRYCHDVELQRALERAERGEAKIIPIVLRPCEWQESVLGKFMALPRDGKPVTKFADLDDAFLEIAKGLRAALASTPRGGTPNRPEARPGLPGPSGGAPKARPGPRSSNLHISKKFTQLDKDRFKHDAYEFIARYIEGSLAELQARNPGVEGVFRPISADEFTAHVYRNGQKAGFCRVYMGSDTVGGGIAYAGSETMSRGSLERDDFRSEHILSS